MFLFLRAIISNDHLTYMASGSFGDVFYSNGFGGIGHKKYALKFYTEENEADGAEEWEKILNLVKDYHFAKRFFRSSPRKQKGNLLRKIAEQASYSEKKISRGIFFTTVPQRYK